MLAPGEILSSPRQDEKLSREGAVELVVAAVKRCPSTTPLSFFPTLSWKSAGSAPWNASALHAARLAVNRHFFLAY